MTEKELMNRLRLIDTFKKDYLSSDRHGPSTADDMYLKLLSMYLRGKDSISRNVLKLFEDRLSTKKSFLSSLMLTKEMRIMNEQEAITRELENWERLMGFVVLPFDYPESKEFPLGISRCIEDKEHQDDYSFDTLIRILVNYVSSEPANKYTLYKALFFYLVNAPHGRYNEQLEYICKESSNKEFFRMLFMETTHFISNTTYEESTALLREKYAKLTAELEKMSAKERKTVCLIYVDGIARHVI